MVVVIQRCSLIAVGVLLAVIVSQLAQSCSVVLQSVSGEYSAAPTDLPSVGTSVGTTSMNYSLAYEQSDGFFDDISEEHWRVLQQITRKRTEDFLFHLQEQTNKIKKLSLKSFDLIEPDFSCPFEQRIGIPTIGDGPKWICDPHRLKRRSRPPSSPLQQQQQTNQELPRYEKPCLVYSIGSRGDFSFESAIHDASSSGCDIHTFDPDPKYAMQAPPFVTYHAWGLKSSYHRTRLSEKFEFKTIQETVQQLGHVNRTIDIFKIDCEGCEYVSYKDWIHSPLFTLRQVLVEVHKKGDVLGLFTEFFQQGYVVFHKETNVFAMRRPGIFENVEFSLLKMSRDYRGEVLQKKLDSIPLSSSPVKWITN